MFRLLAIITVLLAILPLSALNDLNYEISSEIRVLGPIFGEDFLQNKRITSLLFDMPMTTAYAERFIRLEPLLFEAPFPREGEVVDGKERFIFKVRDDIKWHDGHPFTAEDIVFTFECIRHPQTASNDAKKKVEGIAGMQALENNTLVVDFMVPYTYNTSLLTFHILPKHLFPQGVPVRSYDDFFLEEPVGTGRFKFDMYSSTYIELKRNDHYFRQSEIPENINSVKIRVRGDSSQIANNFLRGSTNFFTDVPPSEINKLNRPNISVVEYMDSSWQLIAFNLRNPVLQDKAIRKAINLAIDKDEYNYIIYQSKAWPITGPFPRKSEVYDEELDRLFPGYNIEAARELLSQNGYHAPTIGGIREKNGVPLSFRFSYNISQATGETDNLVSRFIESMEEIGIEIIDDPLESQHFERSVMVERDFDMVFYEFQVGIDPNIYPIFHSDHTRPGGLNITGLDNAEIDALLDELRQKYAYEHIIALYHELHRKIGKEYVGVFLWQAPKYVAYDKTIFRGIQERERYFDPLNLFRFIHKW